MRSAAFTIALLCCLGPAAADVRNLPVPAMTLYPGDALTPAQLINKQFTGSPSVLSGYVNLPAEVAGKFARRTLVAGLPISRAAIRERDVVFQGTAVAALFEASGLTIQASLLPLENGAPGDAIRARNPDSGLTITATVQDDGTLRVAAQ